MIQVTAAPNPVAAAPDQAAAAPDQAAVGAPNQAAVAAPAQELSDVVGKRKAVVDDMLVNSFFGIVLFC